MTLLPRKLNGLVSCDEVARYSLMPVNVKVLGELLPGACYRRPPPHFCDDSLASKKARIELETQLKQEQSSIHAVRLFQISNCLIFGQGSVVLSDLRLLKDSVREFINHGLAPDGCSKVDADLYLPRRRQVSALSGVSVLVKRPWWRNFGHWMVDLMPLLPLLRTYTDAVDYIIFGDFGDGPTKSAMRDSASKIFPTAECVWMDDGAQLEVETLLYVEPVHIPPLFKHPQAIDMGVDHARFLFDRLTRCEPGRRVYISRQNTSSRRIDNAAQVEVLLQGEGFETAFPEQMTFAEQIALFETAKVVIGVKGAAMTNAIFCAPGTHVVLLTPPDFIDPFFWDLLAPRGIKYSEIFCAAAGDNQSIGQQNITVDTAVLASFLQSLSAPESASLRPQFDKQRLRSWRRAR